MRNEKGLSPCQRDKHITRKGMVYMRKLIAMLLACLLGLFSPIALADDAAPAEAPDYTAVLDAYRQAAEEHWDGERLDEAGLVLMLQWFEDALSGVGYALMDLNGDGADELLIGLVGEEDQAQSVFALYGWDGSAPVLIFEGWYRNDYQLRADGTFFNWGSGSAYQSIQCIRYLDGLELLYAEGVYIDFLYDEEHPYFFSLDDDWDAQNDQPITEEEADAILLDYASTLVHIDFTPLSAQDW